MVCILVENLRNLQTSREGQASIVILDVVQGVCSFWKALYGPPDAPAVDRNPLAAEWNPWIDVDPSSTDALESWNADVDVVGLIWIYGILDGNCWKSTSVSSSERVIAMSLVYYFLGTQCIYIYISLFRLVGSMITKENDDNVNAGKSYSLTSSCVRVLYVSTAGQARSWLRIMTR